jgi:hypothetical protein
MLNGETAEVLPFLKELVDFGADISDCIDDSEID